jgi:hypothetical protein
LRGRPELYSVPDDRDLVAQELLPFENAGSDDLDDFVESRFSAGRPTMKVPMGDAAQTLPLFDTVERGFTIIAALLADPMLALALRPLVISPRGVEVAAAPEMEASR